MKKKHNLSEEYLNSLTEEQRDAEMAEWSPAEYHTNITTVGVKRWGNMTYRIAVSGDNQVPSIYLYDNDEDAYFLFVFEVSLVDLLCRDELVLLTQIDGANRIRRKGTQCSWRDYESIKTGLRNFLRSPCEGLISGIYKDHLEHTIVEWNRENDFQAAEEKGINVLGRYFRTHQLEALPEYREYLKDYN